MVSLKGRRGRGCGAEHAAHTAVRAVPIAGKREPWRPAAAATAGPAGPRLAQLARRARRGRSVLTAPALASGVLYAAQGGTPGIKPVSHPR